MGSAPGVQAEFAQLTRNYDVTKKQYDELLSRLDSARLGAQAATTGLVKFQVIDPPAASYHRCFPSGRCFVVGVFFLALGAGIASAYLLHMLRPVIVSTRQLTAATGLPVLGAVSMAWAEKHRVERHQSSVRYAYLSTGLLVLGAVDIYPYTLSDLIREPVNMSVVEKAIRKLQKQREQSAEESHAQAASEPAQAQQESERRGRRTGG